MSTNPLPKVSAADQDFSRLWAESIVQVLEQFGGSVFTATPLSPATADEAVQETIWSCFKATGHLSGEFAFQISRPDALRVTQLFMSEPYDASAAWDQGRAESLREIMRKFAAAASTFCTSKYGGEVQFSLETGVAPEWQPLARAPWVFAAPKVDPLQWTLALSPELQAALKVPSLAGAATAAANMSALHTEPSSQPAEAATPANLDLLLDVELEASLRFGKREMLLRDILELHPGSVIELDRHVQEPTELVVAGRVVAHGEVVIVDGHYGLRITDIAQASQRLESIAPENLAAHHQSSLAIG